jgi:cobalt-zinc-cadmium efflux system outer membrane protein
MQKVLPHFCCVLLIAAASAQTCLAQQALTWAQIRERFESSSPSLRAAQIGVDESRAGEITAYLRPNPNISGTLDQINPFTTQPSLSGSGDSYRPFAYALPSGSIDYLHERQHKRELRLESAKQATEITTSQRTDLERNLLFNLRTAFVQMLQSKAVLDLAKENLAYYDHVLGVNRDRYKLGAIAEVDLDRLELQRVQYETDLQTADVNLRTAKIQLLALLNDRTPVEQFDVTGAFDFSAQIGRLEEVRRMAVDIRPDRYA